MRSGYANLGNGYLRLAGIYGGYWFATSGGATSAYNLYFNPSDIYSTLLDSRHIGFSARCLVSGDWFQNVRSGYVDLSTGYLRETGSPGYYWNATSGGSTFAYSLGFNPSKIYPTILYPRYLGFSARCLASGA